MLINREALLADLQRVFDGQTTEVLPGVLGRVARQMRAADVMREDLGELHTAETNVLPYGPIDADEVLAITVAEAADKERFEHD